MTSRLQKEFGCEFLGTFLVLLIGCCANCAVFLTEGPFFFIKALAWSFGVFCGNLMIYGAHLNPAVSLANFVFKTLNWKQLIVYIIAQFLGAFLGSSLAYFIYREALQQYDKMLFQDHGILVPDYEHANLFTTYPKSFVSFKITVFNEIIGTTILTITQFSFGDKFNKAKGQDLHPTSYQAFPLANALLVLAIQLAFGYNTGAAINPARDFGPRLMTYLAGFGHEVFSYPNHENYYLIPICVPFLGSFTGPLLYKTFISNFHPTEQEENQEEDEVSEELDESYEREYQKINTFRPKFSNKKQQQRQKEKIQQLEFNNLQIKSRENDTKNQIENQDNIQNFQKIEYELVDQSENYKNQNNNNKSIN